jgi:hypothetical protein
VRGETATIAGSNARLVQAVAGGEVVPSSMQDWRARRDCSRASPARPSLTLGTAGAPARGVQPGSRTRSTQGTITAHSV